MIENEYLIMMVKNMQNNSTYLFLLFPVDIFIFYRLHFCTVAQEIWLSFQLCFTSVYFLYLSSFYIV